MRRTRRLLLASTAAIAAILFGATAALLIGGSANAQTPTSTATATATPTTTTTTTATATSTATATTSATATATATGTTTATATGTTTATATSTTTPTATATATPTATTPPATTPAGTIGTPAANKPGPGGSIDVVLTGAEEVPPVPGSQTGRLTATISGSTITYRLQATGTGLTMSHFHSGAAGTNGPVVAFLFGPDTNGVNSIDVGGTITVDSLVGPMKGDMDAFLAALRAGTIYANVHSIAYPGGVVRAQIPAVTIPGAPGTGTGLANSSGGIDTFMLGVVLAGAALLAAGATGVFAVRGRNR